MSLPMARLENISHWKSWVGKDCGSLTGIGNWKRSCIPHSSITSFGWSINTSSCMLKIILLPLAESELLQCWELWRFFSLIEDMKRSKDLRSVCQFNFLRCFYIINLILLSILRCTKLTVLFKLEKSIDKMQTETSLKNEKLEFTLN